VGGAYKEAGKLQPWEVNPILLLRTTDFVLNFLVIRNEDFIYNAYQTHLFDFICH
jgi:hypothetical protein